ncbi:hypothetical protein HY992_00810 [Candidatus Micrarchaeota archaeon]|nr:hypothetical protein [Candidatus Micrarchaeota archaeon]
MQNYFTKENIIKVIVVGVVLVFMLEVFAFRPQSLPSSQGQDAGVQQAVQEVVLGTAFVNASVSSFSRELVVAGSTPEFEEKLGELKTQGKVLYVSKLSENMTSLNLASSETANSIAREISETGVRFVATATLSFPTTVEFDTASGKRIASTYGYTTLVLDPRLDVGANVTLKLVASIQGSEVTQYNPQLIPDEKPATLAVKVKKLGSDYKASLLFSWEERNFDETQLSKTLSQAKKLKYTVERIPLVVLSEQPSNESAELLKNLSYVEKMDGQFVVVEKNFTESALLTRDVKTILGENASVEFSPSRLNLTFSFSSNESAASAYLDERLSPMQEIVFRSATLELPGVVEIDGVNYTVSTRQMNGFVLEQAIEESDVAIEANARIVANVVWEARQKV